MIATVDGAPITVGAIGEISRVTGSGSAGVAAALDRAVELQLLYAEAVRRGLGEDSAVAASIAADTERLLVEQYVLAKYLPEMTAAPVASLHKSPQMSGKHGGRMSDAARLGRKVQELEAAAAAGGDITLVPEAYLRANASGKPRGGLVVARIGAEPILWSQVEEATKTIRDLEPPLEGVAALRFVRGIRTVAGRMLLRREAQAALPTFRDEYDRVRARLFRAAITQHLLALEVDSRVALGEADVRAYYDANPGRYGSAAAPRPFEAVRGTVERDARRDAAAKLRAALVGRLRAAARITVDQAVLESLGK